MGEYVSSVKPLSVEMLVSVGASFTLVRFKVTFTAVDQLVPSMA